MSPLPLGASEAQGSNRVYVNLRAGQIGKTGKYPVGSPAVVEEELKALAQKGFFPHKSVSAAGKESLFVAKTWDDITGYVPELRWYTKSWDGGGVTVGWNVTIATDEVEYVLLVSSMDHPYHRFMNCLLNVDFTQPVLFRGFWGSDRVTKKRTGKVLLMCQDVDDAGKEKWIQPAYQERWLSIQLKQRMKAAGVTGQSSSEQVQAFLQTLPETGKDSRQNIALTAQGTYDPTWPYVNQKSSDNKWSFDLWSEFLIGKMHEDVIPRIEEARKAHRSHPEIDGYTGPSEEHGDAYEPEHSTPAPDADDDIPF